MDSLVEKRQVAVFTSSGGFIIPRSALQVDPAVRKLSMMRQGWTLRCHSFDALKLSEPRECGAHGGEAEEQDVDEKMDAELPWKSGLLEWSGSLPNPHQRSDQHTTERFCRSVAGVPLRLVQSVRLG